MTEMGFNISEDTLLESNNHAVVIAEMVADFANIKLTVFDDIKTVMAPDIGFIHFCCVHSRMQALEHAVVQSYWLRVRSGSHIH